MWRSATAGCLGGLAPSGEEAGEYMHKAALTFVFLLQHAYIVVLDQRCYSSSAAASCAWLFYCRWCPQSPSKGRHKEVPAQILLLGEKGEMERGKAGAEQ